MAVQTKKRKIGLLMAIVFSAFSVVSLVNASDDSIKESSTVSAKTRENTDMIFQADISTPVSINSITTNNILTDNTSVNANSNNISTYILNGSTADVANYPFMVLVLQDFLNNEKPAIIPGCGGTLLDESHVLTAAHCVYIEDEGDAEGRDANVRKAIVTNVNDLHSRAFDRDNYHYVSEVYYPSNYIADLSSINGLRNDIAILKLATPVTDVSQFVTLSDSALPNTYRQQGQGFTLIGYGMTTPSATQSSSELKTVDVTFIAQSTCQNDFNINISSQQLCVTGEEVNHIKSGSCQGDSGGPLLYQEEGGDTVQVGVVSFGPITCGDAAISTQSVYTEVGSTAASDGLGLNYLNWISDVMANKSNISGDLQQTITDETRQALLVDGISSVTEKAPVSSNDGGGGGSLGFFSLFALAGLGLYRRKTITN